MRSIRAILFLAAVFTMSFSAKADYDEPITFDQLPQTAQAFLNQYYGEKVPGLITMDRDDYTVWYEGGEKVEFDLQGNWKEINCYLSGVPAELIPEPIKSHVATTFPGTTILKLERKYKGYEVKLDNGLEVEYNNTFQVIDIDD